MKLSDQWTAIERSLPEDWSEANLRVSAEQADELPDVARMLGPLGAGRVGDELAVTVRREGGSSGPDAVRRLFGRLDDERLWCRLELRSSVLAAAAPEAPMPVSVAEAWDAALGQLPRDWSDLLCRLRIGSSALLDRAALLCAPLNPAREPGDRLAFTFRAARRAGYGTSDVMVRRCLERLDEEQIAAEVEVLRQLSETDRVATQGTVWLVGGRHV